MKTSIEWTDESWNPIRARFKDKKGHACVRVSPGCTNCYAASMNRWQGTGIDYTVPGLEQVSLEIDEKVLLAPLSWKKPRMVFVCSMTDLFADFHRDEWLDRIFAIMALCPQHTFQVLTKRAERMERYFNFSNLLTHDVLQVRSAMIGAQASPIHFQRTENPVLEWSGLPMPNVWLGVSTENQATANERIPHLLRTPAAVRWISAEPLLGGLMLTALLQPPEPPALPCGFTLNAFEYKYNGERATLDWVVAGGESGTRARPMHPDWVRDLRDQCWRAGVPFFFKQWGEWQPIDLWVPSEKAAPQVAINRDGSLVSHHVNPDDVGGHRMMRVGKKAAGALLDGLAWRVFPERRADGSL